MAIKESEAERREYKTVAEMDLDDLLRRRVVYDENGVLQIDKLFPPLKGVSWPDLPHECDYADCDRETY